MSANTIIPATPSVEGTTDDSARGGLFIRSNLANPISGADIQGIAINDSTITININGETRSFTTNQAGDSTLSFTIDTPDMTATGPRITDGDFDPTSGELTLTRSDGTRVIVDGFVNTQRTDQEINDLIDARAVRGISQGGTALTRDAVTGVVNIPSASIDESAFEDSTTVEFEDGNGATVRANARIGAGNGTAQQTFTFANSMEALIVDPATNFQLSQIPSTNTWVFQAIPTGPTQTSPSVRRPVLNDESVFDTAADVNADFVVDPGTSGLMVADAGDQRPTVTRTPPGGSAGPINPMGITTTVNGNTVRVTIDSDEADQAGTYMVSLNPLLEDSAGMNQENVGLVSSTYDRFIPYFIADTQPTNLATLQQGTASNEAWTFADASTNGILVPGTTTRNIFISVLESDVPTLNIIDPDTGIPQGQVRINDPQTGFRPGVSAVGTPFTVQDAVGEDLTYQVIRVAGVPGGARLFFTTP